jgi:uncharacterized protein YndB with AHSA1/START domain
MVKNNSKNTPATNTQKKELLITRVFDAPRERVWKAWTDPKEMVKWWSPEETECRDVQADFKIGGTYRIHMVSKDGDHTAYGTYTEIVPHKRLQFTWAWKEKDMPQTIVTVEFESLGKTTRLTLTHEGFVSKEEVESHTWGWTTCLEKRFTPYIKKQ